MTQLISDMVKEALVIQLSAERYNASAYLYIASWLNGRGLNNLAAFFEKQDEEEIEHSRIIYKLLTDLGATFPILEIAECNMPLNTMSDVANLFLSREIETTNSLKEIMIMASDENEGGCPVVQVAMQDMLKLQQAELDEATTFADRVALIGDDLKFALLWDASLG